MPHYDRVISDELFLRGYSSLQNQANAPLYEVLVYHDGPVSRPVPNRIRVRETSERHNDWGHSLRDLGIREARGDYVIHFNPDNVLYSFALREIELALRSRQRFVKIEKGDEIVIFPILMRGMQTDGRGVWRVRDVSPPPSVILTGLPPAKYFIDCMQLVMKREVWLREGGWKDKSEESDGNMYPGFVKKYGARYVGRVLGEHW